MQLRNAHRLITPKAAIANMRKITEFCTNYLYGCGIFQHLHLTTNAASCSHERLTVALPSYQRL